MEEQQFLKTVVDEATKALVAGGYKNIEYFDENIIAMNGPSGKNVDDEETVARMIKPINADNIILTLAFEGDGKYTIIVTIDKGFDYTKYDKSTGDILKRLAGQWGAKLNYRLDTWGGEIKHKDDRDNIKHQIQGKNMAMDTQISEARTKMTGTTRSSYQKVGECKVIIRHTDRVNEEKFGARSRNINSIFIETKGGERFKIAENNLHGARAMARHLSNNGSPFDTVGVKITTMMEEMKQLREMAIESRGMGKRSALTEEQSSVILEIKERYVGLRESLKQMSGKVGYMKHTLPIQEADTMEVDTETKAAKNKKEDDTILKDQAPVYDRPTDGKDKLVRDADDLFSVNENKYGTAPEETMLESFFNDTFDAEFFKEEELVIEDETPTIKKTLPENALGMLNMYMGHPLFNHYMGLYESQEIMDDVISLIEEGSKLWKNVTISRGTLNEFFDSAAATDFEKALTRVSALISDRRLSLENAINQVSKEVVGEDQDDEALSGVSEKIWSMAEDSGLVKHDFGSTFSDQVLSPNDTVSSHTDEIEAEEYYGDAKFAESVDTTCSCGCENCGDGCKCPIDCDCGCNALQEGDPFARQSKRNLKNPKARMSLISPEDKIGHGMKGLGESEQSWAVKELPGGSGNWYWHPIHDEKYLNGPFASAAEANNEGSRSINEVAPLGQPEGYWDTELIKKYLAKKKEQPKDVGESKARRPNNREDTMMNKLSRGGEKGYKPRDDVAPDDKYAKMAQDRDITKEPAHKKVRGVRENDNYVEVDMPHHLPQTEEVHTDEPTLSEDGARIIQLARYRN